MSAPGWRLAYVPALDGLRAVAVGLVVLAHSWGAVIPGGGLGVDVFFVLSGFLITALLLGELQDTGSVRLLTFGARRVLRLGPALLIFVTAIVAFALCVPAYRRVTLDGTPFVLTYVSNWARAGGEHLALFGHTWSLAVEEQFYLLWPIALLAAWRLARLRGVLGAALGGVALSLTARALMQLGESSDARISNGFDTRSYMILSGCAAATALFAGWRPSPRLVTIGAAIGASFIAAGSVWPAARLALGETLAIPFAGGVVGVIYLVTLRTDGAAARCLSGRPLVYLGRISYGIYLWHYPFAYIADQEQLGAVATLAMVVAGGVGLAALSFRFVESPFTKFRLRLGKGADRHRELASNCLRADATVAGVGPQTSV